MRKIIWCWLRVFRNHPTSKQIDALLDTCMQMIEKGAQVKISQHHIVISNDDHAVDLWNENKWYAWISCGNVDGVGFDSVMPSRSKSYDFKKFLEDRGYNLHFGDVKVFAFPKINTTT